MISCGGDVPEPLVVLAVHDEQRPVARVLGLHVHRMHRGRVAVVRGDRAVDAAVEVAGAAGDVALDARLAREDPRNRWIGIVDRVVDLAVEVRDLEPGCSRVRPVFHLAGFPVTSCDAIGIAEQTRQVRRAVVFLLCSSATVAGLVGGRLAAIALVAGRARIARDQHPCARSENRTEPNHTEQAACHPWTLRADSRNCTLYSPSLGRVNEPHEEPAFRSRLRRHRGQAYDHRYVTPSLQRGRSFPLLLVLVGACTRAPSRAAFNDAALGRVPHAERAPGTAPGWAVRVTFDRGAQGLEQRTRL